ncbi:hypothetical protein BDW69DRAFT_163827 [Aspergillus filifer]
MAMVMAMATVFSLSLSLCVRFRGVLRIVGMRRLLGGALGLYGVHLSRLLGRDLPYRYRHGGLWLVLVVVLGQPNILSSCTGDKHRLPSEEAHHLQRRRSQMHEGIRERASRELEVDSIAIGRLLI